MGRRGVAADRLARLPDAAVTAATLTAVAYTGAAIAATGGSASPAGVYPVLILVYAAGFLGPRAAAAAIAGLAGVHALPLVSEDGLARGAAELAFTAPVYAVVGGVILGGRRLLEGRAFTDRSPAWPTTAPSRSACTPRSPAHCATSARSRSR